MAGGRRRSEMGRRRLCWTEGRFENYCPVELLVLSLWTVARMQLQNGYYFQEYKFFFAKIDVALRFRIVFFPDRMPSMDRSSA